MSNGCAGGDKCSCGCEVGNCTCKKIKFEDAWNFAIGGAKLIFKHPVAKLMLKYFDNFIGFPIAIEKFTSLYGEKNRISGLMAGLDGDSDEFKELYNEFCAVELAIEMLGKRNDLVKKRNLLVSASSAAAMIISYLNSGHIDLEVNLRDKLLSWVNCGCEPCGKDEDDPPPGTKPDIPDNPVRYDPLALDLNHNGKIDTTSINGSDAYFDIDGNDGGIREHMGWLGGGDGFLVQDLNGNGKVDGISELFGSYTVNAFDDLKNRIDSNGDGIIDAKDDLFNTLQVWIDSNGNGVTDEGELHSLASLGITSIDTNKEIHTIWDGTRNMVNSTSSFTKNGEEQPAPSL